MGLPNAVSSEAVPSREHVLCEVKRIAAEFSNVGPDEIQENNSIFEDLGWDSLDVVECTMEIEEEFGVSVPDDLSERVRTIGEMVDGVLSLVAQPRR